MSVTWRQELSAGGRTCNLGTAVVKGTDAVKQSEGAILVCVVVFELPCKIAICRRCNFPVAGSNAQSPVPTLPNELSKRTTFKIGVEIAPSSRLFGGWPCTAPIGSVRVKKQAQFQRDGVQACGAVIDISVVDQRHFCR